MAINDATAVFWAMVCAAFTILAACVLLTATIAFLAACPFKKEFYFMIRLLVIILLLTTSSIALVVMTIISIKKHHELKPDWHWIHACVTFIFWTSSYLCVWLIAFKYHEQSRQMLRIEQLTA